MVEIDQGKGMSMRDLNPPEEWRVTLKLNDELEKVHIRIVAKKFTFINHEGHAKN